MDISDVDRVSRWRALFRWATRPAKPDQEPWRRLAVRVRADAPQPDAPQSIMLVAAGDERYEARCTLELAECLAEELGKPVLVVDASPRERPLSRQLRCAELRGFTDALVEPEVALADIVLRTTHPNVSVVPAGIVADPAGHVAQDRVASLLQVFLRDHAVVLFSGGAVLTNGLALALTPLVDRVLLLAAENETAADDLDAAQECLRLRNARDVGLVLATRTPGP